MERHRTARAQRRGELDDLTKPDPAAVARGLTVIANAASEPHVQDLCVLLNRMGGQITGIIDYYDAVTTDRPFQKAIAPHEATRQLYEKGLEEFNRFMVERFIQCIGIYPFGTFVLLDTEEMGIVCGVKPEMLLRPNVLVIYQNSKMAYPQPFLADLTEKTDRSSWYKRSIIMPLEPEQWNIRIRDYLGEHKGTPRELAPAT